MLDADLAAATKTGIFKKKYPERFFDCGIQEANMMGVAAGIATTGRIPVVSTFAMFAAGRAYEPIRNAIGYPHLNVKICATHAGITVGEDGATHQCNEDIALMRTIPGMTVICPADQAETAAALETALTTDGPFYIRLGRFAVPDVHGEDYRFTLGKSDLLRAGTDVTVVATGFMVHLALEAAEKLQESGVSARVIDMHTVKPLDRDALLAAAKETGAIVTAEEHSVIGGLGGAVSEAVAELCPVPVLKVGLNDTFGRSGNVPALLERYGLTSDQIVQKALAAIAMKRS